jgi:hypothetical protein
MCEALLDSCHKEVNELHRFFEQWFKGLLDNTDAVYRRLEDVLGEGFEIISPGGSSTSREELVGLLRGVHGTQQQSYRIWIENFRGRVLSDRIVLACYEEWQQAEDGRRGRLSSAVFSRSEHAPNRVQWLHVHETWLPD